MQSQNKKEKSISIAIVGTGFGGLCAAIQLKKNGFHNFVIYEKSNSVGGTWRENTYPGAACDVPSHLYSFSFEPNSNWPRKYSAQPEILSYLKHCAEKYGILSHIRFGIEIKSADWDDSSRIWKIKTSENETLEHNVFISAVGQLNRPALPSIKGLESFKGRIFHSANWDPAYNFSGKKVAAIGTGASAIQFIPQIVNQGAEVTVFQRTAPWVVPKPDRKYFSFEKFLFKYLPGLRLLHRFQIYIWNEIRMIAFQKNNHANKIVKWMSLSHMKKFVKDPELRKILTPDYPAGCKRILLSNDYYEALAKPNTKVLSESIKEATPEGIVTKDGLQKFDAIVFGTGFKATEFLSPMKVKGTKNQDLNEVWKNGAEAYLGVTVAGFPNFYILYGPNTNLAHNSIVYMIESQVRYLISALSEMNKKGIQALIPKTRSMQNYNTSLNKKFDKFVWDTGCTNWYINASGKNTNNWPGHTYEYSYKTRKIDLSEYEILSA
ncbi:NAD(P)/FAD-dependent oxidoreductase [Leptospira koniambonensis]|uniref:NAD(P)/FAD-dependent oxidoreductase n=1 Tax=Leptospira koniambonensis TaxID=2484950 RepID=A0A4R9J8M1_9LEPT|nr:NAD(P)/FAD-dependent oxidoreductase [Leptospira koniambonensis]TGL34745.1 NAD(P)/FAD-dependent oxidoreductase [Leptospira koniambonensis]